jgi:uracil-DNA glycosylase
MTEFDEGPPPAFATHLSNHPDYSPHRDLFWFDWGPIFYRGRLDGSARVLCVASDPGATERIAMRILEGDAGQRVQGFLAKIGVTRSYICFNAFVYALHPGQASQAKPILSEPGQIAWRNTLFDMVKTPDLQAVVAFGVNAQKAVQLWPGKASLPVFNIPHPTSHVASTIVAKWSAAVPALRATVTPDVDGDPTLPNYSGGDLVEDDYRRVPLFDLPFGVPEWLGDDSWVRTGANAGRTSVTRPHSDPLHSLLWRAPEM